MKTVTSGKKLALWLAVMLADVTQVSAAEPGLESGSDLLVWIFLAFCALILLAQLVPAAMVLLGFAKGIKKEDRQDVTEKTAEETITDSKIQVP